MGEGSGDPCLRFQAPLCPGLLGSQVLEQRKGQVYREQLWNHPSPAGNIRKLLAHQTELGWIIHLVGWYATSGKWTFLSFSPRKANITGVSRLAGFPLVFLSWYGLNSDNFRNTF